MPHEGGIMIRTLAAALATTTCLVALASPAAAQTREFNIPAGSLRTVLDTFARQSGRQVIYRGDEVRSTRSPGVRGARSAEEALDAILVGTGFKAQKDPSGAFAVAKLGNASAVREMAPLSREWSAGSAGADDNSADIVVTGTRIKGAPSTFPVTTLSRNQMAERGQNDLGEAIRSLPQNFNGGQNPGVSFGASGSENVTSGSALNLRGLGPDATLTLLNGHRLAYDSANQSIDISAIPVAAIERLEIVPDGASALYGSDAVGGVANVILRRDFSGLDTQIRVGSTTEGGGLQQEYSVVGGSRWSTGGVIATADVSKVSSILAGDRAITSTIPSDTTLDPSQRVQSFVLSGHQSLDPAVTLSVDSFYTHRTSFTSYSYAFPNVLAYGSTFHTDLKSWSVAPKASIRIGSAWEADIQGVHGEDKVATNTNYFYSGENIGLYPVNYSNRLDSIEASVEGPLYQLPAGAIRLAAGGGYRSIGLRGVQQVIDGGTLASDTEFQGHRHTAYAYGELFVPVFGPANARDGLYRLDLTLAGRFEHDAETGSIFTPRIGINYEPTPDFGFEGSWGRSFKEPTVYQQASPTFAVLGLASSYATGYPVNATIIARSGANPDLKPERARTLSGTFKLHPTRIPGLHVDVSYFNIHYRNRILAPIDSVAGALDNPLYTNFITLDPSTSALDAVVSTASGGLENISGQAYDPANVVAIIDNRYHNLSRYTASGVDMAVSAVIHLPDGATLAPDASASYLKSSRVTLAGEGAVQAAGTIYNPPHWRARLDAPWTKGSVTIAPAMNLIGGVIDTTSATDAQVRGMTTFDLTLRYVARDDARIKGLEVALSVLNIANRMPGRISVPASYYPAFDSTNYSAQGRYVGVTVGKRW